MNKKIYAGLCVAAGIVIYANILALIYYSKGGTDNPSDIFWSANGFEIITISLVFIAAYSLLCVIAYNFYKQYKRQTPAKKQISMEKTQIKQHPQKEVEETEVSKNEWLQGTGAIWLQWLGRIMLVLGFMFLLAAFFVAILGEWRYVLSFLIAGGSCFIWVPIFQGFVTIIKAAKLYIDEHSK